MGDILREILSKITYTSLILHNNVEDSIAYFERL